MSELTFVDTTDLLNELKSRFDVMVMLASKEMDTSASRQAITIVSKGNMFACQSLTHHYSQLASDGLYTAFTEEEEEEEDDAN